MQLDYDKAKCYVLYVHKANGHLVGRPGEERANTSKRVRDREKPHGAKNPVHHPSTSRKKGG